MKLASLTQAHADGKLILVGKNNRDFVDVSDIAPTMQFALDNWANCAPALEAQYTQLNAGNLAATQTLSDQRLSAPLPRAWQWLDGSLFLNHGHLMQQAFHLPPIDDVEIYPLVYQGAGDSFIGPKDSIVAATEQHGIDMEGEFGVIVDHVPMGCSAEQALDKIRLIVMLNDISFRALAPREMKTGFGFVQGKGSTGFAPFAITPDELGDSWAKGRIHLPLEIRRNGEWFGCPDGSEMHFGFHQLIAHIACSRAIKAGTVIGSGTVSNANPAKGQACISELRAKEMIKYGAPRTAFLQSGERVSMRTLNAAGDNLFGDIQQHVLVENSHV